MPPPAPTCPAPPAAAPPPPGCNRRPPATADTLKKLLAALRLPDPLVQNGAGLTHCVLPGITGIRITEAYRVSLPPATITPSVSASTSAVDIARAPVDMFRRVELASMTYFDWAPAAVPRPPWCPAALRVWDPVHAKLCLPRGTLLAPGSVAPPRGASGERGRARARVGLRRDRTVHSCGQLPRVASSLI